MARPKKVFTQVMLSEALGISTGNISKYKKKGMPVDSIAAASAWCHQEGINVSPAVPTTKPTKPNKRDKKNGLESYDRTNIVDVLERAKRAEVDAYNRMTDLKDSAGYDSAIKSYNAVMKTRAEVERLHNELILSQDMLPASLVGQIVEQIIGGLMSQVDGWPKSLAHRANPKAPEIAKDALEDGVKQLTKTVKNQVKPELVRLINSHTNNV